MDRCATAWNSVTRSHVLPLFTMKVTSSLHERQANNCHFYWCDMDFNIDLMRFFSLILENVSFSSLLLIAFIIFYAACIPKCLCNSTDPFHMSVYYYSMIPSMPDYSHNTMHVTETNLSSAAIFHPAEMCLTAMWWGRHPRLTVPLLLITIILVLQHCITDLKSS